MQFGAFLKSNEVFLLGRFQSSNRMEILYDCFFNMLDSLKQIIIVIIFGKEGCFPCYLQ